MLDIDRADLHARAAVGAGPERLFFDDAADHWSLRGCRLTNLFRFQLQFAQHRHVGRNERHLIGVHHHLAHASDDFLGPEWLVGCQRRADGVAAPAFGAGVAIEQLLPGELLERFDAVVFALFDVGDDWQRRFWRVVLEEDVERCRHQVQVLGDGQIAEEEEDGQDMDPIEDMRQRLRCADAQPGCCAAEPVAEERPLVRVGGAIEESIIDRNRSQNQGDEAQDDGAIFPAMQVAFKLLGADDKAPDREDDDSQKHQERKGVDEGVEDRDCRPTPELLH